MIRAGVLRTQPRARFSRIAQLASTRLRRGSDPPRAYVEPVDRRTSVRFRVSSGAAADPWPGRTSALTAPAFAGLIDLG